MQLYHSYSMLITMLYLVEVGVGRSSVSPNFGGSIRPNTFARLSSATLCYSAELRYSLLFGVIFLPRTTSYITAPWKLAAGGQYFRGYRPEGLVVYTGYNPHDIFRTLLIGRRWARRRDGYASCNRAPASQIQQLSSLCLSHIISASPRTRGLRCSGASQDKSRRINVLINRQ